MKALNLANGSTENKRRELGQWTRITVLMDGSNRETSLHHACHVKPIVGA